VYSDDFTTYCTSPANLVYTTAIQTYELNANTKYCIQIAYSMFINGKPIHMTSYEDGVKKTSGKGVFICVGDDTNHNYHVIIESDVHQIIYLLPNVLLYEGYPYYISNKKNVTRFNLLSKSKLNSGYYYSTFLHLGPINTNSGSLAFEHATTSEGRFSLDSSTDPSSQYTYSLTTSPVSPLSYNLYLMIDAYDQTSSGSFKIALNSTGASWVTIIDGFITMKYHKVYSTSDFQSASDGLSAGAISGIAVAAIVAIVGVILAVVLCKKKNNSQVEQDNNANQQQPQYQQQQYAQPQAQYVQQQPILFVCLYHL